MANQKKTNVKSTKEYKELKEELQFVENKIKDMQGENNLKSSKINKLVENDLAKKGLVHNLEQENSSLKSENRAISNELERVWYLLRMKSDLLTDEEKKLPTPFTIRNKHHNNGMDMQERLRGFIN